MANIKNPKWLWRCPHHGHGALAIRAYPPRCTCGLRMAKVQEGLTDQQRMALREANR